MRAVKAAEVPSTPCSLMEAAGQEYDGGTPQGSEESSSGEGRESYA